MLKIQIYLFIYLFIYWTLRLWPTGKFQNATPPTVMILFQPNFSWMFHVPVFTKVTYWHFEILKFHFKKQIQIFQVVNIGSYGRENLEKKRKEKKKKKNATPPTVMFLFQPSIFWMFLWMSSQTLLIGILKIHLKKTLKFITVTNGKKQNCQYLGNGWS